MREKQTWPESAHFARETRRPPGYRYRHHGGHRHRGGPHACRGCPQRCGAHRARSPAPAVCCPPSQAPTSPRNPDDAFAAAVAAIACEGLAGQIAAARMGADDGVGSFRAYLLDAISTMNAAQLAAGAAIEEL